MPDQTVKLAVGTGIEHVGHHVPETKVFVVQALCAHTDEGRPPHQGSRLVATPALVSRAADEEQAAHHSPK
jgi:hypothetical protein